MLPFVDGAMKQETNAKAFDNFASSTKHSDATKSVTITDQIEGKYSFYANVWFSVDVEVIQFSH